MSHPHAEQACEYFICYYLYLCKNTHYSHTFSLYTSPSYVLVYTSFSWLCDQISQTFFLLIPIFGHLEECHLVLFLLLFCLVWFYAWILDKFAVAHFYFKTVDSKKFTEFSNIHMPHCHLPFLWLSSVTIVEEI